jgi:predicted  nucleic acid-binding Zn-ribbon protein
MKKKGTLVEDIEIKKKEEFEILNIKISKVENEIVQVNNEIVQVNNEIVQVNKDLIIVAGWFDYYD